MTEKGMQPHAELPTVTEAFGRPEVTAGPEKDHGLAAQLAATEARRRQYPGRTTWAPTDHIEPVPAPAEVVDGEGEVWTRTSAGTWYMLSFNPACHEERDGDYLMWRELVDEYGPLTTQGIGL
ncbi:hypothetical protein ACGFWI_05475 [Streptomyces sp. NPDC048434]|uniref:hypothetical protein n=1 Tax=Streptomyces sp. NPDC048434 TaxID=3365549 RepID=UPI003714A664